MVADEDVAMLAETLATGAEAPYWQGLAQGIVQLPRCGGCGRWHWPAVWRCGHCGSWEQAWERVEARGEIYAWTRTWHRFGGIEPLVPPFVSVLVTLPAAGGIRLLGLLEQVDDETRVAIGQPVMGRAVWADSQLGQMPVLRWRLQGEMCE